MLIRKRKNHLEDSFQRQVVNLLRNYYHLLVFAVPNGGSRNAIEASNLKKQGVLAGVADLIVVKKNKVIFLELKVGKNKQSDYQLEFQKQVEDLGHKYFLCYDLDDVIKVVENE